MWVFSLNDAVQLIIPWACGLLLSAVVLAYMTLYLQFRERLYLSGLFISFLVFLYVLFEALVIVSGWAGWSLQSPYFHRIGQLISIWFTPALMFFAWTFYEEKSNICKLIKWAGFLAGAVSFLLSLSAFIFPESFISSVISHRRAILSPGDFYRGTIGPLYTFRDLFLGAYMLFFTILAVIKLVKSNWDQRYLFILMGIFFVFWGAADDMIYYRTNRNFFLNQYRFSRVALGVTLMVFFFLASLLAEFLKTQRELQKSYNLLHQSEQKYRLLSDGVNQAIFSLNQSYHIHSYNNRADQLFSINGKKNICLPDLLLNLNHEGSFFSGDLLAGKIEELETLGSTRFKAIIKDRRTEEPEEYEFVLNALEGNTREFIGRATRLAHNRISHYVEYEKLKLSIENYIVVIDDVSSRLTSALSKYMDTASMLQVKMGLQEMIINAIEHGNLGITFEEKSAGLERGNYREFLKQRQQIAPYKNRNVSIEYVLTNQSVKYLICDEGKGFDFEKTLTQVAEKVDREMLPHGRGIRMTKVIFDKVKYNNKGNQVLLEKRLTPP